MSFKKLSKNAKRKTWLVGAAVFLLIAAAAVFIFSFFMLAFESALNFSAVFATLSVAFGSFAAALYISKRSELRGISVGFIVGTTVFAAVSIASAVINGLSFSGNTVFRVVIILLAAMIGGIWGAGGKKEPEYI